MSPSFNYDGALKETHGMAMSPMCEHGLMFYIGPLPSSGFHIGLFPWSGAAYLVLLLFTFVSSAVLSIVL